MFGPASGVVQVGHSTATFDYTDYDNPKEAIANLKQIEYRYCGSNPK